MKKKNNKPLLVLIAGKSGSGKDYVTNIIIEDLEDIQKKIHMYL